jgi:hypothetical protein
MASTRFSLSEQIMFLLQDGDPKQAARTEMSDIKVLVGQVINKMLKVSHFNETMRDGDRIPDGLMLATYLDIDVVAYGDRSKATLPAVPISLPRGVGLFQVIPMDGEVPNGRCEYFPIPAGQWFMIKEEGLISDLMGDIGYENYGTHILFTKDLTTMESPVSKVCVRMAVVDVSKLGDYDLLPVPADMEADVIRETYNILSAKKDKPNKVDPSSENKA